MKLCRIMAHRLDVDGAVHPLSIATVDRHGYLLTVEPYRSETANTGFRNGTVVFRAVTRRRVNRYKLI